MKLTSILAGFLSLFLLLGTPLSALAASKGETGPHGGVVVGNESHRLELSIDRHKRSVEVYVIKNRSELPDSIGLTLIDPQGNARALELRALESATGKTPQYHGSLGPHEQSYIGFELRIPLRAEPPLVLRSEKPEKSE